MWGWHVGGGLCWGRSKLADEWTHQLKVDGGPLTQCVLVLKLLSPVSLPRIRDYLS